MSTERFGAAESEWYHFDAILGLGRDLLPVVSNPAAVISPQSKMKALGKTPSRYNKQRHAAGIAQWTQHASTDAEIARWSTEPDYGICIQTRTVRAIDCDITDLAQAVEIHIAINDALGFELPVRLRGNSSKILLAFSLAGDAQKRTIKTAHGIIEFLATGQQFIACGTHPSGTRYEWAGGIPTEIATLSRDRFEALWTMLESRFATEPSKTNDAPTKAATLAAAASKDPTAVALQEQGRVLSAERDGRLHITCPFSDEHTAGGDESATTYFPANTGGYQMGHFHCLHAHCGERTDRDFLEAIGLGYDPADDFEACEVIVAEKKSKAPRYAFVRGREFSSGTPAGWIVKGVIPKAELGVIYGPPGSGKSFFTLDIAMAVVRGEPWCGKRVAKGRVGYIAAEGAGGFRNRLQAYYDHCGIAENDDILVLAAVPNLLTKADVVDLGNAIIRLGGLDILVYDTLARGTSGGDENSAQDMGLAIDHCRVLHDVTGAMVILVHHSGKDATRGARGSNAVLAAVDVEIEISRFDDNRTATVSKLKDGQDGDRYGFKLIEIPIGMDEDGDIVSSCVLEHGLPVARPTKEKKMGEWAERIWHTVLGMQHVDGTPPTIREVLDTAVDATPQDPDAKADRRRDCLMRGINALERAEKIKVVDDCIVIVGGGE